MSEAEDSRSGRHNTKLFGHLDLIAEMSQEFATTRDIDETLQRGLQRITTFMGAEAASLFLIEPETGELVCHACTGPVDITGLRLPVGHGIVGRTVAGNEPTIVDDVSADPDFGAMVDEKTGFRTRSLLCAPLSVGSEVLGAVELINKREAEQLFQSGDRQVLQALAAAAALSIINARLTDQLVAREAMRRELELAAEIQRGMLPGRQPGDAVMGVNVPARQVSGDFYDIVPLPDGRIAFCIGDVSGKGMNAALLMAKTSSLFRCLVKSQPHPARLLATINAELCETGNNGMFVTMVAGLFDPMRGVVTFANAGHEPPLLVRDGVFTEFPAEAPPLGVAPELVGPRLPESVVSLEGGSLYLFTDGLTEAWTAEGGMVGPEGVRAMLVQMSGLPPGERLAALTERVVPSGGTLRDDLTVLLIADRRTGRGDENLVDLRVPAHPSRLHQIRDTVARSLRSIGCGEDLVLDVVMAVDEACQNVIRHAYRGHKGDLVLNLCRDGDKIVVQLMDFADPVDPAKIVPRDLPEDVEQLRPGGLGTHIMHSVMDEVAYVAPPPGVGNMLLMTKTIR